MQEQFLEKLTIVIYTYNRHRYLKRTLKYWSSYNIKILVLDGSSIKLEDELIQLPNIKYVYDPRGLYQRLKSSCEYINTEFMILGCDDEFYLPSALSSCVNFLIHNQSYSTCGGIKLGFKKDNNQIVGRDAYTELKKFSLNENCALERVKKHMENYTVAHVYSVIRTFKWDVICKHVFKKEFALYAAFELQIEFLLSFSGKTKIIPELMHMRNLMVKPIRGTSPSLDNVHSGRLKWWFDQNLQHEREDFFKIMSEACKEIKENSKYLLDEKYISILLEIFFKKIYLNKTNMITRYLSRVSKLIPRKIIRILKIFDFRKIKNFFKKIEFKKKELNLSKKINILESENIMINHLELNRIILILDHECD